MAAHECKKGAHIVGTESTYQGNSVRIDFEARYKTVAYASSHKYGVQVVHIVSRAKGKRSTNLASNKLHAIPRMPVPISVAPARWIRWQDRMHFCMVHKSINEKEMIIFYLCQNHQQLRLKYLQTSEEFVSNRHLYSGQWYWITSWAVNSILAARCGDVWYCSSLFGTQGKQQLQCFNIKTASFVTCNFFQIQR